MNAQKGWNGRQKIPQTDSYFKILFEISVNQEKGESHLLEWPSLKSLQIANAGEGVEKREPSDTVGEAVN